MSINEYYIVTCPLDSTFDAVEVLATAPKLALYAAVKNYRYSTLQPYYEVAKKRRIGDQSVLVGKEEIWECYCLRYNEIFKHIDLDCLAILSFVVAPDRQQQLQDLFGSEIVTNNDYASLFYELESKSVVSPETAKDLYESLIEFESRANLIKAYPTKAFGLTEEYADNLIRQCLKLNFIVNIIHCTCPPDFGFYENDKGVHVDMVDTYIDGLSITIDVIWNKLIAMSDVKESVKLGSYLLIKNSLVTNTSVAKLECEFWSSIVASNNEEENWEQIHSKLNTDWWDAQKKSTFEHYLEVSADFGIENYIFIETEKLIDLELNHLAWDLLNNCFKEIIVSLLKIGGKYTVRGKRFAKRTTNFLDKKIEKLKSDLLANKYDPSSYSSAKRQLETMVGLTSAKAKIASIAALAKAQSERAKMGVTSPPVSFHAVFSGNPGTGKTTVSRYLGKILKSLGVLEKGHVVECDRSRLVAEYIGQTAVKTNQVIDEALGGILFIDEAYTLARGDHLDFGKEAIDTLLKRMEDNRDNLVVIVAGYTNEMKDFISANPGLESRFNHHVLFEDYSISELVQIFFKYCGDSGLNYDNQFGQIIANNMSDLKRRQGERFGNGRSVRNLFEKCLINQAIRLELSNCYNQNEINRLHIFDLQDAN
jgi:hypothetical protein